MTTQPHGAGASTLAEVVAMRARGLRAELQMSQVQMALAMGISRTGISDRLTGVKDFDLNELPRLAQVLNTSVEYLMGFTDERSPRRTAPGGGSMFVLSERSSDTLRACRDSNPKPSDLWPAGRPGRRHLEVVRDVRHAIPTSVAVLRRGPLEEEVSA